nr:hypothetical protein [Oligoflexales bacterium]
MSNFEENLLIKDRNTLLYYIFGGILIFSFANLAYGNKTNQCIYEDPFDVASGGANLTRATQTGILFANPAQLPYGGKFFRWLGLRTTFIVGKDSVDFAREMIAADKKSSTESESGANEGGEFVDRLLKTPVHFGSSTAVSFLTNNGGLSAFYRVEPDIQAKKYSETGTPAVVLQGEAYGGAIASIAGRTPWRNLSLGLSAKYLYAAEPYVSIQIADQQAIESLSSGGGEAETLKEIQTGTGFDAGLLYFVQSSSVDFRLALKADDVGNTKFSGDGNPKEFKQTFHGGLGLTFHNQVDALHLSFDYRDVLGAYEEKNFKKLYMGAKLMIRTYVGVGVGYYQGAPSYGIELDLFIMRISGTLYT